MENEGHKCRSQRKYENFLLPIRITLTAEYMPGRSLYNKAESPQGK